MAGEVIGVQGVRITDLPEAEAVVDSNYMILVDEVTGRTYKVKREHIKAQKTSELVDDVGYMTESEVKEFTEAEIAQIREVLNTWEAFKNSGGKINGSVTVSGDWASIGAKDSSNSNHWYQYVRPSGDGYVFARPGAEHYTMTPTQFSPVWNSGSKILGEEGSPWKDIYLNGMSKSDNGYTKLPNGFIMQWGLYHCKGGLDTGVYTVQFPITFPNKVLNCVTSVGGFSEHEANGITNSKIIEWYNSDFKIKLYKTDKYVGVNTHWMAIGY